MVGGTGWPVRWPLGTVLPNSSPPHLTLLSSPLWVRKNCCSRALGPPASVPLAGHSLFYTAVKSPYHEIDLFNRFQMFSSVTLNTFTAWCSHPHHPSLELYHIATLNRGTHQTINSHFLLPHPRQPPVHVLSPEFHSSRNQAIFVCL